MSNTNEITTLEINCSEEMESLVRILTLNGYEVKVKAVFENAEDIKERFNNHVPAYYKPRTDYWLVEIVGKVEMPKFLPSKNVF